MLEENTKPEHGLDTVIIPNPTGIILKINPVCMREVRLEPKNLMQPPPWKNTAQKKQFSAMNYEKIEVQAIDLWFHSEKSNPEKCAQNTQNHQNLIMKKMDAALETTHSLCHYSHSCTKSWLRAASGL